MLVKLCFCPLLVTEYVGIYLKINSWNPVIGRKQILDIFDNMKIKRNRLNKVSM